MRAKVHKGRGRAFNFLNQQLVQTIEYCLVFTTYDIMKCYSEGAPSQDILRVVSILEDME